MNFKVLKNKKIYITPFSSTTLLLCNLLCKNQINFLGFIDKQAKGENIITKDLIKDYDFIIICSPNHNQEILNSLHSFTTRLVHYYDTQFYLDRIPYYIRILKSLRKKFEPIQIRSFKNRHPNDCAIVLHTASSALDLQNISYPIFASHTVLPILESTTWHPDYIAITDLHAYIQYMDSITQITKTTKFFPKYFLSHSEKRLRNSFYLNPNKTLNVFDLDKSLHMHFNVTFTLISTAVYMGCKEIFIYGMSIHSVKFKRFWIPDKYNELLRTASYEYYLPIKLNLYRKEYAEMSDQISPYHVKLHLIDEQEINSLIKKNSYES